MKFNSAIMLALLIMLEPGAIRFASAQNEDGRICSVRFVVLRDSDGKPVRNAAIVLHPVKGKGKQGSGEMDLKTDAEGRTTIDGIPYGPLRVQVLAQHFQTFGADYEVNKAEMEITVKLKHPGEQYSIYENHDDKKPQ